MLFDIRVDDTDARSYRAHSPRDVLGLAEVERKRNYLQACQDQHATFTPLCVSVDGMLGSETEFFVTLDTQVSNHSVSTSRSIAHN